MRRNSNLQLCRSNLNSTIWIRWSLTSAACVILDTEISWEHITWSIIVEEDADTLVGTWICWTSWKSISKSVASYGKFPSTPYAYYFHVFPHHFKLSSYFHIGTCMIYIHAVAPDYLPIIYYMVSVAISDTKVMHNQQLVTSVVCASFKGVSVLLLPFILDCTVTL